MFNYSPRRAARIRGKAQLYVNIQIRSLPSGHCSRPVSITWRQKHMLYLVWYRHTVYCAYCICTNTNLNYAVLLFNCAFPSLLVLQWRSLEMPVKQVLMLLVCDLLFIDILIKRVVFGSDGWHIYLQYKHTHTHAIRVLFLEVHHLLEIWMPCQTGSGSFSKPLIFNTCRE